VATATPTKLNRTLSVRQLVFFGLAYLAPITVFTTYGLVSTMSDNRLPLAYIIATIAMLFTALSYGKMASAIPVAGSAYTYVQQTFGGSAGFLAGWTLMLDYLFLPMVNFMVIGIYANLLLPDVPAQVLIVIAIAITLSLNLVGINLAARANIIIVLISLGIVVAFVVGGAMNLASEPSTSSAFDPFNPAGDLAGVYSGAAVLALSFLGFDAVSTMSEESNKPRRDIPRAILLTALIGGAIFIVVSWVGALVWTDVAAFASIDTAGTEIFTKIGGETLAYIFTCVYIVGAFGSGIASQISISRLIYAMGRDRVLPSVFGKLSKARTPFIASIAVSIVSLAGLFLSLADVFNMVSFGALFAFSIVNLAVIKYYLFPKGGKRSANVNVFSHGVLPLLGFALTIWLWTSLAPGAFMLGLYWMAAGIVILAFLTKFFTKPAPVMDFSEKDIPA
jgi:amino acid transporter